ncbi:PAS domain S-box protein [Azospirillum sp.]|uniref:PAS domain S-box protein n=1 Tax=Azospirillum sp. TaxID=34012 RepID=UPI002D24FDE8|nr:PAS domain S-box protein [Azospirillum sp.]HYD69208.1 PAS domain S-box protein [Azospirillum sp.]
MSIVHRLLLLLLAIAPFVGFQVYTQLDLRASREAEIHQQAEHILDLLETEHQRIVDTLQGILTTLATTAADELAGPSCQTMMERLKGSIPEHLTIEVTDLQGIVRCATDLRAVGVFLGDRANVRRALETGRFSVGDFGVARGIGRPILPYGLPYDRPGGGRGGVITGLLDLKWLTDYLARKPLPPNASILLTDSAGVVIARVPERPGVVGAPLPERFRHFLHGDQHGLTEVIGVDGIERMHAYSPPAAGSRGVMLGIGIDKRAAMWPIEYAALWSAAITLLLLLLSIVGAFWGIGRLSRSIEAERSRLKAVLQNLPVGVVVAEVPSGRLVAHNSAAERLIGRPIVPTDTVVEFNSPCLHPDGRPYEYDECALVRAMRDGDTAEQEEVVYRHPDGHLLPLIVNASPIRDDAGRICLAVMSLSDISGRKAMEAALRDSETRYRGLVETQADMVVRFDAEGRFIFINDTTCRLLGRSRDALLGSPWRDAVHTEDVAAIERAIEETLIPPDHRASVEARMLTVKGPRWFSWEGYAIIDDAGQCSEVQAVGRDVTGRKAMETALRQAKEAADQGNLAKTKFLAAASHDLRQPMQSMFMFAAALHPHVVSERGRNALVMLERGLDAMKGLLESLLDVSRLDADVIRPTVDDLELRPVLDHIGAAYQPVAAAKGLELYVDSSSDVVVRSDRNLLGRMIRNLVENAIRYTEQGFIRLTCRVSDGRARIEVHDTGIGIPGDQLGRIFDEFHQVGNAERDRSQGLGLGLSIVQRLSRLLDHPVEVQSEPDRGSVFSITIPLGEAPTIATREPQAPIPQAGHGRYAVLIDDDAIVLLGLQATFREWQYQTLIATSADQAVERLKAEGRVPDVIIADYRLRGGERGTNAVRRIRETLGRRVPAIILTGETGLDWQREAADLGYGVAFKPIAPRQLYEVLRKHLGDAA